MKLSIIIPVFFEEQNILKLFSEIQKKINTPCEALIIYDLDNDPTVKVSKDYIKKNKLKNIFLIKNSKGSCRGVLNAIKTGISNARYDVILISMADLSDDYSKIDAMFALINNEYDIVCASRYMKGGRLVGGPFIKQLLSRLAGLSAFYLFKLPTHDPTNAFKMYKKSIFKKIKIESTGGFEYSLEIMVKALKLGYKIGEIPTTWKDRAGGKSKFKLLKWIPKYLRWYLWGVQKNFLGMAFKTK